MFLTTAANGIPEVIAIPFAALQAVTHSSGPWPNVINQLVSVIFGTAIISCKVYVYKWVFAPASLQNLCRYRLTNGAALQCIFPAISICIDDVTHPASRKYAYDPGDVQVIQSFSMDGQKIKY